MTITISDSPPFIRFESTTFHIMGRPLLPNINWDIRTKENWLILGPNGSGKSVLMRAIMGEIPVTQGRIIRQEDRPPSKIFRYLSFERHQRLIAREQARDHARYFSGLAQTKKVMHYLADQGGSHTCFGKKLTSISRKLHIHHLFQRDIRHLSTGEIRRVLIAGALLASPQLLILDEPFIGLDRTSRDLLRKILERLIAAQTQVILITHRHEEIPVGMTHVLYLKNGRIVRQGKLDLIPITDIMLQSGPFEIPEHLPSPRPMDLMTIGNKGTPALPSGSFPLIEMKNIRVAYGETVIINNLNWHMIYSQNWAMTGPNGCGKTTLLRLIAADHLQAYANNIRLFGCRRGSGESIWEIKQKIGRVSSEVQLEYCKPLSVVKVVVSGFFDSIGLYHRPSSSQIKIAENWLKILDIDDLKERFFNQLSHGQQRMVLLARAMVKSPLLLILDEPCQGLDPENRHKILQLIDKIGRETSTHLLYVTHHEHEIPECITHILHFNPLPDGSFDYRIIRPAAIRWNEKQHLVSTAFDDIYFTGDNGPEESRHVFLKGNHLPERWKNNGDFTIIETGFGTGLNFLVTWQLWQIHAAPEAWLHYISVEKFPVRPAALARIYRQWPTLEALGRRLLEQYPGFKPGIHLIPFENERLKLTLILDDIRQISSCIDTSADAWFLDGFNPSCNPEMWNDTLFKVMSCRTRPGGTFATFTSAGFVKRGLRANGFDVQRITGYGKKRHMLRGDFTDAS
jgi:molybdate transport system ATP-binding protein